MYLLYIVVKDTLYYIVIAFRDSGDVVHNNMSYTYCTIAIYDGTPFLCSFLVCLYNTYYMAAPVMDIRCVSYTHSLYYTIWPCLILNLE